MKYSSDHQVAFHRARFWSYFRACCTDIRIGKPTRNAAMYNLGVLHGIILGMYDLPINTFIYRKAVIKLQEKVNDLYS